MSQAQNPADVAEMRMEQAEHRAATQTGHQQAQRETIDLSAFEDSDIIQEFAAPDIARDIDDDLEEMLSAEFSRHLVFGNIDRDEWEEQKLMDKARSRLAKMEFAREGRIGSKCNGQVRQIMTQSNEPERPMITDDMGREIDAAFEERTMARSLAIDGQGFRGLSEAIVWTRSDRGDSGSGGSKGGLMGRLFG